MVNDLSKIKAAATIRDGTFSEGFFDMVIYANKVDSKNGQLSKVFIFDERNSESPLTIISKEGQIIQTKTSHGNSALLRLLDGDIHKANLNSYTKIKFHSYDINLFDPAQFEEKQKSLLSFNYDDLIQGMIISSNDPLQLRKVQIEFHRRAALAIACLLFSILGVGFGTITNRRSGKGGGFTLCLGLIVSYWILYVTCEGFAKSHLNIPTWSIIWFANFCFAGLALYSLKRASV